MADKRIGQFKILRHLGRGSAANVFMVRNEEAERPAALKMLKPVISRREGASAKYVEAAQATTQIQHPLIAKALGTGAAGPTTYIEMEFVQGFSVAHTIQKQGPLELAFAVGIANQAAAVLNFVQNKFGITHGYLTTKNIFLSNRGGNPNTPVITDLGLAGALFSKDMYDGPETFPGDPAFVAPEVLAGESPGPGADVYCIGALLLTMITGKPLYEGTREEVFNKALNTEGFEIPYELPAGIADLIAACLEHVPASRPANTGEVAATLSLLLKKGFSAQTSTDSEPEELPAPPPAAATASPDLPDDFDPDAPLAYLHLDQDRIILEDREKASLYVQNPGDGLLKCSVEIEANWLKVSPREFEVAAEGQTELKVSAAKIPAPSKRITSIKLVSNGGDEELRVIMKPGAAEREAVRLKTAAMTVSALLASVYFIWGIYFAPQGGWASLFLFSVMAVFGIGAMKKGDAGIAVAGFGAVVFGAIYLMNISSAPVSFFIIVAASIIPMVIVYFISEKIFIQRPADSYLVFLWPVFLFLVFHSGSGMIRHGAPFADVSGSVPLAEFGRRTVRVVPRDEIVKITENAQPLRAYSFYVRVTVPKANIRQNRRVDSKRISTAGYHDIFPKVGENEKWFKIRLPGGRTGWIARSISEEVGMLE